MDKLLDEGQVPEGDGIWFFNDHACYQLRDGRLEVFERGWQERSNPRIAVYHESQEADKPEIVQK